ncbi:MAG: hypothetical protein KGL35_29235 [Bradyrhizobium sp.]|nr:hypothetical protein [Bradyrhizobium sp.]
MCACSPVPVETVKTVTVKVPVIVAVPKEYTAPISEPNLAPNPNDADLTHYILLLKQAIAEANARLALIAGLHK